MQPFRRTRPHVASPRSMHGIAFTGWASGHLTIRACPLGLPSQDAKQGRDALCGRSPCPQVSRSTAIRAIPPVHRSVSLHRCHPCESRVRAAWDPVSSALPWRPMCLRFCGLCGAKRGELRSLLEACSDCRKPGRAAQNPATRRRAQSLPDANT